MLVVPVMRLIRTTLFDSVRIPVAPPASISIHSGLGSAVAMGVSAPEESVTRESLPAPATPDSTSSAVNPPASIATPAG